MRSSSTRLRFGAALSATSLIVLLGLGGSAYAGEKGQGDEHRNAQAGAGKTELPTEVADDDDSQVPDPKGDTDNAHPSGNDRHEDKGTQGLSTSDPDDDGRGPDRTNGGPDKPFATTDGSGGVDRADQDGNNGCGNDDDFEDDNEGWCGKPAEAGPPPPPPVVTTGGGGGGGGSNTGGGGGGGGTTGAVLGSQLQNAAPAPLVAEVRTEVLGETIERPTVTPAPAPKAAVLGVNLARTGFSTVMLALIGLALVLFGVAVKRSA